MFVSRLCAPSGGYIKPDYQFVTKTTTDLPTERKKVKNRIFLYFRVF